MVTIERMARVSTAFLALALASCTREATPLSHAPVHGPTDAGPPSSAGPTIAAASDAGPSPIEVRCPGIGPGEISDDETPAIRGVGKKSSEIFAWFEARGVTKTSALAFLASYHGRGTRPVDAENYFSGRCSELTVGDKSEPALACQQALPDEGVMAHAVIFVVRASRPVVVLDVGLNLTALDWPDARSLDLMLDMRDGGRTAELRDRAPDGTKLVAPPSACVARQAELDQCEKDFANEPDQAGLVSVGPSGSEMFLFYKNICPIERGPDKKLRISRKQREEPFPSYPATTHDCASALASNKTQQREPMGVRERTEWRRSATFVEKSCAQRGTWVWRGDRFAKQPAAAK